MKRLSLLLTLTLLFSLAVPISAFANLDDSLAEVEDAVKVIGNVEAEEEIVLDEEAEKQLNELLTLAQYEFQRENEQVNGNVTTNLIVGDEEQNQTSNENISVQNEEGIKDFQVKFPASNYNVGTSNLVGGTLIIEEAKSQSQKQNSSQQHRSRQQQRGNNQENKGNKRKNTEEKVKRRLQQAGRTLTKKVNGKPLVTYKWGGNTTPIIDKNGNVKRYGVLDCSGLVKHVYNKYLDKDLTRITTQQYKNGKKKLTNLSASNLKPGDLLFNNGLGHVGIYIGDGKVLHNSRKKGKPVIVSLKKFGPQQGVRYLNI